MEREVLDAPFGNLALRILDVARGGPAPLAIVIPVEQRVEVDRILAGRLGNRDEDLERGRVAGDEAARPPAIVEVAVDLKRVTFGRCELAEVGLFLWRPMENICGIALLLVSPEISREGSLAPWLEVVDVFG
ncbi:MAG: hypothetical protein ABEK03_08865 [Candidatus Bipolaricaulia bacterium]